MAIIHADDLIAILRETPFTRDLGFELATFAQGRCSLHVPFDVRHERPGGIVAGGRFMAAADVAAWLAIKTLFGRDDASVTVEASTRFLTSLRRSAFFCDAEVLKAGHRLVTVRAECRDADRRLLTHHMLTYVRADGVGAPPADRGR